MPETQPSIFDEKDAFMLPPRRALLPKWIIFFCWFFIVLGILVVMVKVMQLFNIGYTNTSPFRFIGRPVFTIKELLSFANSIFSVVAAYGLLKEKDWAINVAITNGFVSSAELLSTFVEHPLDGFTLRFEMIMLIAGGFMLFIYLRKLFQIRTDWSIRLPRGLQL